MSKLQEIEVQGTKITVNRSTVEYLVRHHESNVGLNDVADVYLYSGNVLFARHTTTASRIRVSGSYIQQLIRVDVPGVLERIHNPDFNYGEFATIKSQTGLNSYKISVKQWAAEYKTRSGR